MMMMMMAMKKSTQYLLDELRQLAFGGDTERCLCQAVAFLAVVGDRGAHPFQHMGGVGAPPVATNCRRPARWNPLRKRKDRFSRTSKELAKCDLRLLQRRTVAHTKLVKLIELDPNSRWAHQERWLQRFHILEEFIQTAAAMICEENDGSSVD
jgi:hypothetical protein